MAVCGGVATQFRALLVGAAIGTVFSIIIHKLSLTTGIIPSLNIAAGLIGFIAIKGWVTILKYFRFDPHDFTPQVLARIHCFELNTVLPDVHCVAS